MFEVSWDL